MLFVKNQPRLNNYVLGTKKSHSASNCTHIFKFWDPYVVMVVNISRNWRFCKFLLIGSLEYSFYDNSPKHALGFLWYIWECSWEVVGRFLAHFGEGFMTTFESMFGGFLLGFLYMFRAFSEGQKPITQTKNQLITAYQNLLRATLFGGVEYRDLIICRLDTIPGSKGRLILIILVPNKS